MSNFMKIRAVGAQLYAGRHYKANVAFRNFAKAPKKRPDTSARRSEFIFVCLTA
jgi:hypothetical protein